jgi:hypothetical protein
MPFALTACCAMSGWQRSEQPCLSTDFTAKLNVQKEHLNCLIYSVLCAGRRTQDHFSDEVVVL